LVLNEFVRNYHLNKLVAIMADAPIFFAPVFLLSAWVYWAVKHNDEKKKDLIFIFFSIVASILTNLVIQHFVDEARPETFVQPLIDHLPDASFPSDHAAVSFAFLTSLYLFGYKKIFWIYLPFVILMNVSRIAAGVHWFFDVLVGMFVGIFWAIIFKKLRKNSFLNKIANFFVKLARIFRL
jgi:undecaprenyl-diphosphatase